MVEIMDTGHVNIDGSLLRTWSLAYLDSAGTPSLGNEVLVERIGMVPRWPIRFLCHGVIDYMLTDLVCYSDSDITFPGAEPCSLQTSTRDPEGSVPILGCYPNPGTDQLWITGLTSSSMIEVRDPLGRLVHSQTYRDMSAPIGTASWASGSYFVMVVHANGARELLRWMKQ
ncbi:MAG: T9SS type A sorting domain-containing protein [Flavobacteriales bacterium]|nr:T9SS type A sorting domain-containing protein [Flavobacteriales bacterium]